MIIITNDQGQQITIKIAGSAIEIDATSRWMWISKEDARELRRFLEALG